MYDANNILDRIARVEGLTKDEDIGKLLGYNDGSTISKWRSGKLEIQIDRVIEYWARKDSQAVERVLYGKGENPEANIIPIQAYTSVRGSKRQNGNGDGLMPIEWIGIPRNDYNKDLIAYRQNGDEMGEIIPDGSIVLVNQAEKDPIHGKMYLFKHHYAGRDDKKRYTYIIRRVEIKVGVKGLLLIAENTRCGIEELAPADFDTDMVVGRIMASHGRWYIYRDLIDIVEKYEEDTGINIGSIAK